MALFCDGPQVADRVWLPPKQNCVNCVVQERCLGSSTSTTNSSSSCGPRPREPELFLSDATAALDYDIAAEVLDNLDADIDPEDLEDAEPFEEGDLGLLSDIGLPEAVLGVILDETDLYADEQLGRIAREMGFADQLSAVIDRLGR